MEQSETQKEAVQETKQPSLLFDTLRFTILALLIIVPFRMFIAQPFLVNGASMDPTFENAQYLIVDQLSYHFSEPKRGSVLIFKYPLDTSRYFIKRIIGLPGDTVRIERGEVFIENTKYPDGLKLEETYVEFTKNDTLTVTVPENEYFVMGDNRTGSLDSRYWGTLPEKFIIGRPLIRLLPLNGIGLWPGDKTEEDNK